MRIKVWTKQLVRYFQQVNSRLPLDQKIPLDSLQIFYGEYLMISELTEVQFCALEDVAVRLGLKYDGTQVE